MKVLIVTFRRLDLLSRIFDQLTEFFHPAELLVVDNHSDESDSIAAFCAAKGIEIMRNQTNEGFSRAVNLGMSRLVGTGLEDVPWVLLLNPDAELLIDPRRLPAFASRHAAALTTFDASAERPWDSEKPIPNPWRSAWEDAGLGRFRLPQPWGSRYRRFSERHRGYLVGCLLLISTKAWREVGPFDERFWLYSEEVDWCHRAYAAGYSCEVVPIPGYRHYAGQSSEGDPEVASKTAQAYQTSRRLFIQKNWGTGGVRTYSFLLSAFSTLKKSARIARSVNAQRLTGRG